MKRNFGSVENGKAAVNYRQVNQKISIFICIYLWTVFFCLTATAQNLAPGAPGKDAQWSSAGKQAIGTSASLESKVWFTLQGGALTEVYYPDVTMANVHKLEFIVVNPKTRKVETETEDAVHQIKPTRTDSLSFQQINTAKSGEWKITKTYTTDVERDSVLIDVRFEQKNKRFNGYELYVYYDPSLKNTGMHDTAWSVRNSEDETQNILLAQDGDFSSALMIDHQGEIILYPYVLENMTSGFLGISDGLSQLIEKKTFLSYDKAQNGNIVQFAKIRDREREINPISKLPFSFVLVLSFGKTTDEATKNAKSSLAGGFDSINKNYEKGWSDYVKTLPKVEPKYQAQFNMAAMVLKAQEDKTVRGANVASLTIPWGGGANANEDIGGGYHLVWSRDLYQVVTAYMALGDMAAANRALDFLFNIQQKPDGSFPQNSWLDGKCGWCSLQMDEVAYPLIMAYQLKRFDKQNYENHVKKAADFIVKTGPKTPQERWEEKSGYSPSTIAAEIAGLVCAADIAKRNGDQTSANLYLKTADEWQANVEKWTATTNGKYGDGNYYVRLTENGKPDAREKTELNNNAGTFIENEIVDAGFLELVRLGIKSPDDPLIQKSIKVVDEVLRVKTPNGESFYRYNNDGYGEMEDGRRWNWDGKYTGKGRLWALLSGERGQYELAMHKYYLDLINNRVPNPNQDITKKYPPVKPSIIYLSAAQKRLEAMANFANEGLMIAEQIWDKPETPKNIDKQFVPELKFGKGTGSATPLAWSMAQFIRLAVNLQAGKNLDTPDIVYERYVLGKKSESMASTISSAPGVSLPSLPRPCFLFALLPVSTEPKQITELLKTDKEPFIDCGKARFVYKGEEKNVEVVGDFTGWQPKGLEMGKIGETGWRFYEMPFAPTARVEYKLVVDGKWITDPFNANKIDNGVGGENSFFTMPDYKPTVWADSAGMTKPSINIERINSTIYGEREIEVYVPEDLSAQSLPVLYLQDGGDYLKRADAVTIQRNLVKAGKLKPFIIVFLNPKDRTKEYWANDDYAKYVAEEVVPMIDVKYKTVKSPNGRAIMGASLGGITSVHTALKYPEIFGRVGGQSSSWWIDDERVVKELNALDSSKTKLKFYLDDGTLEGVEDSRKAVGILKAKGYDVTYSESEAGHNWTAWRDRLANAYLAIWN